MSFGSQLEPKLALVECAAAVLYYNLYLMMTVCLLLLPMEPRLVPLGRPTLMGPIGNL
jgi:hypothetical protein